MRGSSAKRGTHGLRKRCPCCKKVRKFYRWDDGFTAFAPKYRRENWQKVDGRWVCKFCIQRGKVTQSSEPPADVVA